MKDSSSSSSSSRSSDSHRHRYLGLQSLENPQEERGDEGAALIIEAEDARLQKVAQSCCPSHEDCSLKYVCVDASCTASSFIACAECQIEGVHRKHDFLGLEKFTRAVGEAAEESLELLLDHTDPERIVDAVRRQFSGLKRDVREAIEQIEREFIGVARAMTCSEGTARIIEKVQLAACSTKKVSLQSSEKDMSFYRDLLLFGRGGGTLFRKDMEGVQKLNESVKQIHIEVIKALNQVPKQQLQVVALNAWTDDQQKRVVDFREQLDIWTKESELAQSLTVSSVFDLNSTLFSLCLSDHSIRVIRKEEEKSISQKCCLIGHNWTVTSVCMVDDKHLLSASADTSLKLWDVESGNMIQSIRSHSHEVTSMIRLQNHVTVLTGGKDYLLCFHELEQGIDDETNSSHHQTLTLIDSKKFFDFPIKVIVEVSSSLIAVGYSSTHIAIIAITSRSLLLTFESTHELGLYTIASLDDMRIVSSGGDGKVKVWSIESRKKVAEIKVTKKSEDYVKKLKVIPLNSPLNDEWPVEKIAVLMNIGVEMLEVQRGSVNDKKSQNNMRDSIALVASIEPERNQFPVDIAIFTAATMRKTLALATNLSLTLHPC